MKIFLSLAISLMLCINIANGQTTKTVGATGANYSTLKAAFDAINSGSIKGVIILQITGNTTETTTATLNASGSAGSSYTSVTIYPTVTGKTISGNIAIPLIQLNGAANVTIDGRVDQAGARNLVITNTNTGTGSSTIRFTNSASNNIVKYCTVKGSGTNSGGGVLLFSSSVSGNGNNNNLIDNNNITSDAAGRPCNAIYSSGTSGRENSGNVISNNDIYDFLSPDYSARGVNIASNSIDWTVSGNSFYETTTIAPTATNGYNVISISTSASHLINGNYIGGSLPQCGGTPLTINSSFAHYFYGIYVCGGSATPVTVQNNIIQNINYTSTHSNPWDGINLAAGNINVTGNTIGATTGTGSIVITTPNASATTTISGGVVTAINLVGGGSGFTTAPLVTFSASGATTTATATAIISGGAVTGFSIANGGAGYTSAPSININAANYSTSHGIRHLSTGTVTISNNNIGSITTVGNNSYSHCFESIVISGAAPSITITNNLIGSLTTANSIQTSSAAASSLLKQDTRGILMNAAVPLTTITGNTFANLTSNYTGNSVSKLDGICTYSGSSNTIQNNIIRNLTTGSSSIIVKGIEEMVQTAGTNQTITGNTISDLSNTNTTALIVVKGIDYIGPISGTNTVSGNFIHNLSIVSSNTASEIDGISLGNGVTTSANNIINLGAGITTGYKIYGIIDNSNATVANTNNIYFNSVYVGGVVSSGTTSSTGALWNANNVCIRNYRNNILMNVRSGGATGKHYAIRIAATSGLTINYNDYWVTGTAVLGYLGADKTTLAAWQSATGQDANSLNINPGFTNAGGTSAFDYYSSATLPGINGTGITTDYDGLTRGISPKMGALEVNSYVWQGNINNDFGTAANWTYGAVPPNGADISFAANPGNNCVLDQNRSLEDITNAQGTYNFSANGKQLTITGHLYFSNGAQINATTASSVVLFAGSAAQSIPSGAFVSNIIDGLSVNNSLGLTLNNNLTVSQALTLTNGAFIIGASTLTLNGGITKITGILTGGSSTNITFGGSGASTILPAVSLNNLTLNRTNGIALGGAVSVAGTLALTAGSLTVGSNTLTVSGSSPTRASGSIDASNTGANLIFANTSAILLPVSVFSAVVNNLTISGAGGVTSGSDFSLDGILNLQSVNPSATKGILDMWDGSVMRTLTMGGNATTVGTGDVTGIITRNSFTVNTPYSFGNQYTTLNMVAGGILPTMLSIKIIITPSDISWKPNAIHRYYDIVRTGGNNATKVTLNLHYLDSELNGTAEGNLDLFDYHVSGNLDLNDHGHSNDNISDNWVGLANLSLTYIAPASGFPSKYWTLGTSTVANYTWLGAADTDWNNGSNWVGGIPGPGMHVVIPDASTTVFDPVLPLSATIGSIIIQTGGVLNGGTGTTLTIDGAAGAWDNMGTFNSGTSTVVFTNAAATMSDPTNFYNITVADGAKLTLGIENIMRIAGTLSLSNSGILNAANNQNTIEYNGTNQTVILPNGSTPGYYNLILTGSGTKTMPSTTLAVYGDFTISGSTTVTAGAVMNIDGEFAIENGSTFNTGNYSHFIGGAFDNNGTFNASSGYAINLTGTATQSIYGSAATGFDNLTINNSNAVSLYSNINVNNVLMLTSGNLIVEGVTLGINGTVSKTSGHIEVNPTSSLSFGGTTAITITNDLFTSLPSINNLTINRANGVTLGNQSLTVNGLLELSSGTFSLAANTLTIASSSPTRTTGNIDASNAGANLAFTNTVPVTLPQSIFTGNVNNLTLNGTGGVTASSDFSLIGILNLLSANPSAIKGSLDMLDGAVIKTLTMGANATTQGQGDVTGIIRRTAILPEVTYSFGNQLTTAYFPNNGSLPSQMSAKVSIGSTPSWRPGAIDRDIEIIQTGGSGTKGLFTFHYLDSELNGNTENNLVFWVRWNNYEYGRSAYNATDNWVSLSNVDVAFFSSNWDATKNISLDEYSTTSTLTWNGSVSDSWTSVENWTPNTGPSPTKNIIIPDASTTLYSPNLPSLTEIKTLTIDAAGILNSVPDAQLTINGGGSAWINSGGIFNHNTSNVIFSSAIATLSGTTDFFDVTINNGAALSVTNGSIMRIAGTMHNTGIWHAVTVGESSTVEYNGGNQTIVIPNTATHRYSTLILSGTGTKTMPATALNILGNFSMSGTTSATALNAITTDGDFTIGSGTTFNTGVFSHSIGGNFSNNGTFDATESTITFNGTSTQNIDGIIAGTSFNNLLISNSSAGGVILSNHAIVNNNLTIASGSKLSVSPAINLTVTGTLTNNAGTSGLVIKSGGSLIEHNGVSATVEREITGDEWHLISSPVSDATSGIFTGKYLQMHTESTNAYTDIIPTNIPLTPVKGYALWGNGGNFTATYSGTLNTGTKSYSNSYSGVGKGWNLVGNPYPSSIDWNAATGWTKANVNSSIYLHVNAATWATYNGSIGTNGGSRYIAPCQGFFVEANAAGILSMNNSVRTHNAATFFKNYEEPVNNMIRLQVSGNSYTDEAVVWFQPDATNEFDSRYDSRKLFGDVPEAPQIYTSGTSELSINTLPETSIVPLGVRCAVSGTYTIAATEINDMQYATLEDTKTGIFTELAKSPYIFGFETGENELRFKLHFSALGIDDFLPETANIYSYQKTVFVIMKRLVKGDIYIYNIAGQLVASKLSAQGTNRVNLLNTGNYFVKVVTDKSTFVKKVFIQ